MERAMKRPLLWLLLRSLHPATVVVVFVFVLRYPDPAVVLRIEDWINDEGFFRR